MVLKKEIALKVYMRDNWKCRHCNFTSGLQPHHVIFKSQRGSDELNNLICLCYSCHHGLHEHNLKLYILKVLEDNVLVKFKRKGDWKPK